MRFRRACPATTTTGPRPPGPEIRTVAGTATFVAIPATYGPILRATVRAIAAGRGYNAIDQAASGLLYDSMLVYRNKVPAAGFAHAPTAAPCYRGADWSAAPASYASAPANMGTAAIGGVECSAAELMGSACEARLRER